MAASPQPNAPPPLLMVLLAHRFAALRRNRRDGGALALGLAAFA